MIHQISIKNFKSLRDVTVDLSPVTVFIGKSGTGKTNFASAIRFLRDRLLQVEQQDSRNCRCATNPKGNMEFCIKFKVPGYNDFTYHLSLEENFSYPLSESLECGGKCLFKQTSKAGHHDFHWETEPALTVVPQPGDIALGRLPGIEEAVIAHTALTAAIGVYAFPYDVFKANVQSNRSNRFSGMADDGSNYLEAIRDISRDLQNIYARKSIVASLQRINQTLSNIELDSLQNPQKALVGHLFGDKTLTLELIQESDGFRRFYAHLLALYQKPSKQTLIFEEPENGIYPGALSLLADEFKAAPESGRGQVLLTTHSPALLDHFSADQIRVVELVDLETKIGPLAEDQKESLQEELLHAGELLTVDPARRQE